MKRNSEHVNGAATNRLLLETGKYLSVVWNVGWLLVLFLVAHSLVVVYMQ
jgi:hypothetical protein